MNDQTQSRLIQWSALFLFVQSIILTLSPAVRERSWQVEYRLAHWDGFLIWGLLIIFAHRATIKYLPERDPYLLPAAGLLSGWGLLTIWRLDPAFGLRQAIWLAVSMAAFALALRFIPNLNFLRRYKYLFLSGGIFITATTLIFGTNPLGIGPRLWLGCWGVYFQPSEPLKILLVIYLAAYLADRASIRLLSIPLLIPTLTLTGLALLLLVVQRDLGTASLFISIFTIMIFVATGKRRILLSAGTLLGLALLVGYFFIDIIHVRVVGWLNPWNDPSGGSYQIVQSLLAVANGGTIGRGLGIGSPLLVPVAISDFIYAAIAEETGLTGTLGLIAILWLILARGLIASLRATDRFKRYLAAGMVAFLGLQSLLIIGGNIRLVPLTGVTLPFTSYGGSSLLTSYIALFILLSISNAEDNEPAELNDPKPYSMLAALLALGFAACALTTAWWAIIRGPDLLIRTDNPRRAIADLYVPRGQLVDKNNQPINITEGQSGSYKRTYLIPNLGSITGYTHPVYGQAGVEASLDEYLRGLQGHPTSLILWNQLLYGTPPPGLDVRLSLDLALQNTADQLLGDHHGAMILMNADTGEILVMASHPTFDPNNLDAEGNALSQDETSPLLNRATQGLYPIGDILQPLLLAKFGETKQSETLLQNFYNEMGLYKAPEINMPVAFDEIAGNTTLLRASPLQISLAAAALSSHGVMPAPRIATAVNTSEQGWVVLPTLAQPKMVLPESAVNEAAIAFIQEGKAYWSYISQASFEKTNVTWLLAGTVPEWKGTPLTLVVILEENNGPLVKQVGEELLDAVLNQ
ncbi:MAG TPA: FtsW/RodA/SpoVE family cell cycle protein [Anaerolineales bacterium]|nr:FtsW/RodA/SpoVE family cell cycle protein [Anaerolineales bacterium]